MNFDKILTRSGLFLLAGIALLGLTACGNGGEDVTPPTITITTPIPSPTKDNYTNGLTVNGNVDDPNAALKISATPSSILDPNTITKTVQTTDLLFSFTLQNLVEGSNLVTFLATDAKGNTNTAYLTVVLDTVPPPLLLGPITTMGPPNADQTFEIGGISQAGATIDLGNALTSDQIRDITPTAGSGYSWEKQLTGLTKGGYTLTVTAKDAAGNQSPSITRTIYFQSSAPVVTINPLNPSVSTSNVTLTGTSDPTAALTVTEDNNDVPTQRDPQTGDWQASVTGLPKNQSVPVIAQTDDGYGDIGTAEVDLFYNTAPQVVEGLLVPAKNSSNISVSTAIQVTFDQAVLIPSNSASAFTVTGGGLTIQGTINYADIQTKTTVVFQPFNTLAPNTTYTVTLTNQITNEAGKPFAGGYSWEFATGDSGP